MTTFRSIVSILLLYHLTALTVSAIPSPEETNRIGRVRHPQDAIARWLTPSLDRAATWFSGIEPALFSAAQPLRWITTPYIEAGLRQNWNMFSNPLTDDHYLRLDYHVAAADRRRPSVVRELIFPADREDRIRFFHQFRDKAVLHILEKFAVARGEGMMPIDGEAQSAGSMDPAEQAAAVEREFAPLVRYFRDRVQRTYLTRGERVVRTDVWAGAAPIPPRGQALSPARLDARLDVLDAYYAGPSAVAVPAVPRTLGQTEGEADIAWELIYIDGQ
jgi:hypothetical protein